MKGIELHPGDHVVEMDPVDENGMLLSVTENGYGKRTDVSEYRHQGRGGSGVINVRLTEKNGPVVGIKAVATSDHLLLITEKGILIRIAVAGVRETGRAAIGVRLIDLEAGDKVVGVAKLEERVDETEGDENETPPSGPDGTVLA